MTDGPRDRRNDRPTALQTSGVEALESDLSDTRLDFLVETEGGASSLDFLESNERGTSFFFSFPSFTFDKLLLYECYVLFANVYYTHYPFNGGNTQITYQVINVL